jgi:hypothetical protein
MTAMVATASQRMIVSPTSRIIVSPTDDPTRAFRRAIDPLRKVCEFLQKQKCRGIRDAATFSTRRGNERQTPHTHSRVAMLDGLSRLISLIFILASA